MKKGFKKNYKLILGVIIGVMVSGIVGYAATTLSSSDISYDNSKSGLTSTNLNGAIDELYARTKESKESRFVAAYRYDENINSGGYCITGEESTCRKSECYRIDLSMNATTCEPGDIILYRVNDSSIVTFHYIRWNSGADDIEMQSHNNIVDSVKWGTISEQSEGALVAREALRLKTQNWTNILSRGYSGGCATNCYDTEKCLSYAYDKSLKAHIIDTGTLMDLGCKVSVKDSCPKWVLNDSYWTNDWYNSSPFLPWAISENSGLYYSSKESLGLKAVVHVDPELPSGYSK